MPVMKYQKQDMGNWAAYHQHQQRTGKWEAYHQHCQRQNLPMILEVDVPTKNQLLNFCQRQGSQQKAWHHYPLYSTELYLGQRDSSREYDHIDAFSDFPIHACDHRKFTHQSIRLLEVAVN